MRHPKLLLGIFVAFTACTSESSDTPADTGTDASSEPDETSTADTSSGTDGSDGSTTNSTTDGGSTGTSADSTGDTPLEADLVGTWTSVACEVIPGEAPTYFTRTFELTETTWAIDFSTFGDPDCSDAQRLFRVEIAGPYQIEQPSAVVGGAFEAFFGYESRRITPVQQAAADFMNQGELCGVSTWTVGESVDVHELGCAGLGIQPVANCSGEYDIVALVDELRREPGEALYFGVRPADGNLCTSDRRPSQLGAPLQRIR
jgi:Adenomatosis polyposis coli down-regulated 1